MAKGDANFGAAGKKGYMGGKYSRKAMNLSKKELGKAGAAAASKRTVKISQTSRSDGKTLGPGGKPLTGRVKMGNGNIAVYKAGKRVIAQTAKKSSSPTATKDESPARTKDMTPAAKRAKAMRTGRRMADTAGRAGMALARDKSGKPSSTPTSGVSRTPMLKTTPSGASSASGAGSPQSRSGPFGPEGRVGANVGNMRLIAKIAGLKREADLAAQRQRNAKASEAAKAKARAERDRLLKEIARLEGK